ncbi:MAG TPA: hypothetical protein VMB79_03330, partial [Jatrophihabitans sp.]|nr:hypothetical protein [Jatrophihabitans sp.]
PVLVTGRIYSRQYLKEETSHVAYEVDPESIGHDLARGTSAFTKRRRGMSGSVELDADNLPIRLSDQGYELLPDPDEPAFEDLRGDGAVPHPSLGGPLAEDDPGLEPVSLGRAG